VFRNLQKNAALKKFPKTLNINFSADKFTSLTFKCIYHILKYVKQTQYFFQDYFLKKLMPFFSRMRALGLPVNALEVTDQRGCSALPAPGTGQSQLTIESFGK
jgi:hypothetical protein